MPERTKHKTDSKKTSAKSSQPHSASHSSEETALPRPLSPKEKSVLEFLELYMRENGVSPTYQEICQHFGFASYNSVQRYLKQLESKGYIKLPWANQKRAITLLRPSNALQSTAGSASSPSNVIPAIMPAESVSLPLLGGVAAGLPIEAHEHDEFIDVPSSLVRRPDRTFALRVQGQSMIEDGILDGDVILVQRQTTAVNGEIVVAMIGEEATVKRFYVHRGEISSQNGQMQGATDRATEAYKSYAADGRFGMRSKERSIELRPANSTMNSMWFEPDEVEIRGVVVGLIRKF